MKKSSLLLAVLVTTLTFCKSHTQSELLSRVYENIREFFTQEKAQAEERWHAEWRARARKEAAQNALFESAYEGDVAGIDAALKEGADPCNEWLVRHDNSPLHYAVRSQNVDAVTLLKEHGAQIGTKNRKDLNPVHWAAMAGNAEIIHALMKDETLGDPKSPIIALSGWYFNDDSLSFDQSHQMAPIHWAALLGHTEAVKAFLDYKVDVNIQSRCCYGESYEVETPLHKAVRKDPTSKKNTEAYISTVRVLLEYGADVNAIVRLCARPPANLDIKSLGLEPGQFIYRDLQEAAGACKDATPLDLALDENAPDEVILLLKEAGAKQAIELSAH